MKRVQCVQCANAYQVQRRKTLWSRGKICQSERRMHRTSAANIESKIFSLFFMNLSIGCLDPVHTARARAHKLEIECRWEWNMAARDGGAARDGQSIANVNRINLSYTTDYRIPFQCWRCPRRAGNVPTLSILILFFFFFFAVFNLIFVVARGGVLLLLLLFCSPLISLSKLLARTYDFFVFYFVSFSFRTTNNLLLLLFFWDLNECVRRSSTHQTVYLSFSLIVFISVFSVNPTTEEHSKRKSHRIKRVSCHMPLCCSVCECVPK